MINYGKYFQEKEFKCHHCGNIKINQTLVDSLNQLRELCGRPIIVTSGYRCHTHNKNVGGSSKSQHFKGNAADIVIRGLSVIEMYRLAETIPAFRDGGIGIYPNNGFIHVDVRGYKSRWCQIYRKMISIESYLNGSF